MEPRRLATLGRGDLDWIVLKSLEKDRARRYDGAASLGDDVRRYLAGEAVYAAPPSRFYLARKFVRRHRGGVAAVAAVVFALGIGMAGFAWQANVAEGLNEDLESERTVLAAEVESVKRLSALQDLNELVERSETLWPPHPEQIVHLETWLREAKGLMTGLPQHRAKRDELRRTALEATADQLEADRLGHPSLPRLEALPALIASRRATLLQRRDGVRVPAHVPDWGQLPQDSVGLNDLAIKQVSPSRTVFGREAEGLALAERALEVAQAQPEVSPDEEPASTAARTLARAFFELGRDEEALAAAELSRDLATEPQRGPASDYLEKPRGMSEAKTSPDGQTKAAAELVALEAEREELAVSVLERRTWLFPNSKEGREARWWHANLSKLIESLEELETGTTGLMSERDGAASRAHGWSVPRRLAHALRLRDGLAPDGLWRGEWYVGDGGHNYDPQAQSNEGPVHEVTLSPYWLSKYELTQGQSSRITGSNPSYYPPTHALVKSTLHPVENVSWVEAKKGLGWVGLEHPTEAQWEYGCRAGTETPWWTGEDRESLRVANAVNLADQATRFTATCWNGAETRTVEIPIATCRWWILCRRPWRAGLERLAEGATATPPCSRAPPTALTTHHRCSTAAWGSDR